MFWFVPFILPGLASAVVAGAVIYTVYRLITLKIIRDTVKRESAGIKGSSKFKVMMKDAKKRKVDVGIFNEKNELLKTVTIESTEGISSEVRVNKLEYIS